MNVTGYSATGPRSRNEDSYSVPAESDGGIYLVADGMGGAAAGDQASREACVAAVHAYGVRPDVVDVGVRLTQAFDAANDAVRALARQSPELCGMGTTLVAVAVVPRMEQSARRGLVIANVGDSRCYGGWRLGGDKLSLEQITEDHSLVMQMVRSGQMTAAEAARSPNRHVLSRALGTAKTVPVDIFQVSAVAGDAILLCSDGLTGALLDREIARLLEDPDTTAEGLVHAALEAGADDNVTAVLVRV